MAPRKQPPAIDLDHLIVVVAEAAGREDPGFVHSVRRKVGLDEVEQECVRVLPDRWVGGEREVVPEVDRPVGECPALRIAVVVGFGAPTISTYARSRRHSRQSVPRGRPSCMPRSLHIPGL